MTPDERRLFAALLAALAERFTAAGHLKAQVEHEHRGSCPRRGCAPHCAFSAALVIEASVLLERALSEARVERVEAPVQAPLFREEAAG